MLMNRRKMQNLLIKKVIAEIRQVTVKLSFDYSYTVFEMLEIQLGMV